SLTGRLPPNRVPDRGPDLDQQNSGGTAGELAPDPTRGHVPSVHDVLAGGVDQERGVKQATRGGPADEQQLIVPGQHDVVVRGDLDVSAVVTPGGTGEQQRDRVQGLVAVVRVTQQVPQARPALGEPRLQRRGLRRR